MPVKRYCNLTLEQNNGMLHLSHLQPMLPVYLSCKWPVYNQRTIYQCVQMSHAGNDEILYIYLHIINKEYKYF